VYLLSLSYGCECCLDRQVIQRWDASCDFQGSVWLLLRNLALASLLVRAGDGFHLNSSGIRSIILALATLIAESAAP
jgi:hypothetical protein